MQQDTVVPVPPFSQGYDIAKQAVVPNVTWNFWRGTRTEQDL